MATYKFSTEDYTKLSLLSNLASYHIEDLFTELNIDCKRSGRMYIGRCPVHDGDKANAWNFYPDGHSIRGIWRCRTKQCENVFQKTIPGLVRGILSKNKLGWSAEKPTSMIGMQSVIDFLCAFVGQEWKNLKVDLVLEEKHKFINDVNNLGLFNKEEEEGWSIDLFINKLNIPSPYFLSRDFSKSILEKYFIGDCTVKDRYNPMYNRAVVPILVSPKTIIGATGRTLYPHCNKCSLYHDGNCPSYSAIYSKWRNTSFSAESHLFNFYNAKESIAKTNTVILVEGPVDCLRLVQADIKNVVALFGVNLSDRQSILLESSGAHKIVLLLDKDKAGEKGIAEIKKTLGKSFKIYTPELPNKDPGDLTSKEIEELKLWNY